ncbi:hypothetical protein [Pseudoalteromonas xiamenensis]
MLFIERRINRDESVVIPPDLLKLMSEVNSRDVRGGIEQLFAVQDDSDIFNDDLKKIQFTPEKIELFFEKTRSNLESYPKRVTSLEKDVEEIKDTESLRLSSRKIREISFSYYYGELDQEEHEKKYGEPNKDVKYFDNLKNKITIHITNELEETRKGQISLNEKFSKLSEEIDSYIQDLNSKNSKYYITASITNSGNASVSIKRPGLFRVYIGSGNYVDLKLEIPRDSYKEVAQINERATRLITFNSKKLSELPSEDRKLVNQYWGKNVNGVIFVIDSLSNVESSELTPFSDALYQKQIYDKLIFEASKLKWR